MRCLIVDDDPIARHVLEQYVSQCGCAELAGTCSSAVEASNRLLAAPDVDLLLLDVEMPGMSGLHLARTVPAEVQVVLVTGRREYALEAFDIDATDYLLKPVDYQLFLRAIQRARKRQEAQTAPATSDNLFVKVDGSLVKVALNEILWIEAQGDYVRIHADKQSYFVHSTLKAVETRLPSAFARVHRSFVVRLDAIDRIDDTSLSIRNQVISIGASYKDALLGRLRTL